MEQYTEEYNNVQQRINTTEENTVDYNRLVCNWVDIYKTKHSKIKHKRTEIGPEKLNRIKYYSRTEHYQRRIKQKHSSIEQNKTQQNRIEWSVTSKSRKAHNRIY